MLKKIGAILIFLLVFLSMLVFAKLNPGTIDLDLALASVRASVPLAFAVTFAGGWLFGLLSMVLFVARLFNERRQLRKALRNTESEVSSLRSLPLTDAD